MNEDARARNTLPEGPWPGMRLLCLAAVCITLLMAARKPASGASIRIGFFMSMTGRDASFGEASLRGAQMGIDEVNASGGILGQQAELVIADNRSLAGESATAVKRLISRDHVVALVGECSSARTLEAAPVAQAAGIPLVSPAATNPKVTRIGPCIFRVCFIDPFQGRAIAWFARRRLGLKRVAMLVDSTAPYSVGLSEAFEETFSGLGGSVVITQRYSSSDTDFRAQLTTIRGAHPDGLFVPGYYVAAGLVAQQASQLRLSATLLGGDGFEAPQLLEIGGTALEGTYLHDPLRPGKHVRLIEGVRGVLSAPILDVAQRAFGAYVRFGSPDCGRHPKGRID